jgi:hypothetical protein
VCIYTYVCINIAYLYIHPTKGFEILLHELMFPAFNIACELYVEDNYIWTSSTAYAIVYTTNEKETKEKT